MNPQMDDHTKSPKGRGPRNRAAFVAVAVALCAAACSSGNTSSSPTTTPDSATSIATASCVAKANKFLQPYRNIPTSLPSSFVRLSKPPTPGGTIIRIADGNIPSDVATFQATSAAAKAIGWTAKLIVENGSVEDIAAKWQEAVADKPTAIVGAGNPASMLQQPIAAAKAAGIVVGLDNVTDTATSYPGLAAVESGTAVNQLFGQIHANLLMSESGCHADVGIFSLPFPIFNAVTDGFQAALKANCPQCKASLHMIQTADIGSPAATNEIVSALQADPSMKWVFTPTADVADGLPAALSQANITGVKIFGGGSPDQNSIKMLQDGASSWWLEVGAPINGWLEVDAVLRAIDAHAPVTTTSAPLAILTPQNVGQDTSNPPVYPTNYQQLFEQVWGVG